MNGRSDNALRRSIVLPVAPQESWAPSTIHRDQLRQTNLALGHPWAIRRLARSAVVGAERHDRMMSPSPGRHPNSWLAARRISPSPKPRSLVGDRIRFHDQKML